jgi:hypothetical protein
MVLVQIQPRQQMVAVAYLVKCPTVNGKNRVSRLAGTAHPKLAYSSMEEHYATNAGMKVRLFLSHQKNWPVA